MKIRHLFSKKVPSRDLRDDDTAKGGIWNPLWLLTYFLQVVVEIVEAEQRVVTGLK